MQFLDLSINVKRPVAFLCVLLLLTSTGSAAAMEPGQEPAQYISARPGESAALSTTSRDIANQLGLLPLVDELKSLSQVNSPSLESQLRRVQLKQKINEKVIIAALQVRGVTAAIEEQITDMDRLLGFMQDKRDRAIRHYESLRREYNRLRYPDRVIQFSFGG